MSIGSALTNQIAGAVARQATSNISTVLRSVVPGGGTNSSDTKALDDQGGGSKHLSYPENVEGDEQQGHYVMFMINEAKQGKVATVSTAGQGHAGNRGSTKPKEKQSAFADKNFIDENLNQGAGSASTVSSAPSGSLAFKRPPTVKLDRAITLYMPPSVSVSSLGDLSSLKGFPSLFSFSSIQFSNSVYAASLPFAASWRRVPPSVLYAAFRVQIHSAWCSFRYSMSLFILYPML